MDRRGLPRWLSDQESNCNAGDGGLIPGSGKSPGGGHGNPLQYSCWKNAMDRGAWWDTVHGVTKSQTWLKRLNTWTEEQIKLCITCTLNSTIIVTVSLSFLLLELNFQDFWIRMKFKTWLETHPQAAWWSRYDSVWSPIRMKEWMGRIPLLSGILMTNNPPSSLSPGPDLCWRELLCPNYKL